VKDELLQHVELHVRKAHPDRKLTPDAGSCRGCGNDGECPDRRAYTPSTHGAVRDRRPGHSSHRTLRGVDRPHHPCTIA
jgi:hypothetical protein